jgi:aspartyl-tRNA(Asn)/glutamyl-tRNA(Gln) amidotransferase subunit C
MIEYQDMEFTEKDLDNLSKLARINVSDSEREGMLSSIKAILGYVSEINAISGELTQTKSGVYNVMREDIVTNHSEAREIIFKDAPAVEGDYIKVTQVLG